MKTTHPRRTVRPIWLIVALIAASLALFYRDRLREGDVIVGAARVIDGDSLWVDGREIRLVGIDAPELSQMCQRNGTDVPCGREARQHLVSLTAGRSLSCHKQAMDRYRRALSRCELDNQDIGAMMVRDGHAVAYGRYEREEREARDAGRGVWAGTFTPPRQWRQHHPE